MQHGICGRINKLLRSRKQFARCSVSAHGSGNFGTDHMHRCEVVADIQDTEFSRAQDKREWKKEIKEELD